jgi:hypothetical protein
MNKEMQIIREVSIEAENFYQDAIDIGDHAAHVLTRAHRSQMTGLENIADTALKTSDILDYIKRQTTRFPYWQRSFAKPGQAAISFGQRLKDYIENNLLDIRNQLCKSSRLNIGDETYKHRFLRQHVYLLLIRQFIRQMVVQYEYRVTFPEEKKGA